MRSDSLANSKLQLDADHYGLEKVKRRLMEYIAVLRLRTLISQEAEVEQAKAQQVTLKKVIDDSTAGAGEADNQKEERIQGTHQSHECLFHYHPSRKAYQKPKVSKPPSTVSPSSPSSSFDNMCLASSGHRDRERLL
jgi:hypothetical protein